MVDDAAPGQLDILAEILQSKRVGRGLVRLVGEILLAEDDLTECITSLGEPSTESWFNALDGILDHVEEYQKAWFSLKSMKSVVDSGSLTPEGQQAIDELALSMRAAVDAYRRVTDELRGSSG